MKTIEIVVQALLTSVCENAKQLSQNKFACVHAPVVGIELYRFPRSAIVPNALDVLVNQDVIKNVVARLCGNGANLEYDSQSLWFTYSVPVTTW